MPQRARAQSTISTLGLTALSLASLLICSSLSLAQTPEKAAATAVAEPNDPNATAATALVTPVAANTTETWTLDTLQARKAQALEPTDLAEDVRTKLTDIYDRAIAQFKLAEELAAKQKQYTQTIKAAPAALAEIQEALAKPATTTPPTVPPDMTTAQTEQKLAEAKLALEEARKKAADLENEPKRRAERRTNIPQETSVAQQQLDEIQEKLAVAPNGAPSSALAEANQILLQQQQRALKARLATDAEELQFYDATSDLLAAQRDQAARRVATLEKQVAFWQETVNNLRQQAAQRAREEAAQAQRQTQDADPAIQQAAKVNADLAQEQAALVNKIEQTSQYAAGIDTQLARVDQDFAEIREQIDKAGGVTNVLGVRLLGKRSTLPDTAANRRRIKDRPAKISQAQLDWIEYDNKWSELSDIQQRADSLLEQSKATTESQRAAVRSQLVEYLQTRRKTLEALAGLSLDYATKLANLDAKERTFVKTVDQFAKFIDANVLWVNTSHDLAPSDLRRTATALAWLAAPANWQIAGAALWSDLKGNPPVYVLIVLVIVTLLVIHGRMHSHIERISENVRQIQTDSFRYTLEALALTTLLAGTWPIALLLVAWRLSVVAADDFTRAVAAGLFQTAMPVFVLSFLRHLAMPHGLAQDHFRMRQEPLAFLRRHLRWFFFVIVPVTFMFETMHVQQVNDLWYGTVGRLFFIIGLIAQAVLLVFLLRPTGPLVEAYLKQRRGGWLDRLHYIWYPLCPLIPLSQAVLAGMGYVYGARHLSERWGMTMGLFLAALLIRAVFVRGLVVAQRRLALLERQKRMAAEQKSQEAQASASPAPSTQSETAEAKPEQTIFEMSQQTRRLIGAVTTIVLAVGLWTIWNTVLPAFAKLGEYRLYTIGEGVITLGAVITALVVTILTVIVARNVPGLLEIIVLRRLPIDRGVRFAVITICRYILVIIGVVLAFTEIGIGWGKVQWLIAAMTVGLGFGLQEIFANFVSGLIILFEQPIRVDDIVTVGDVTGRVTMIKIRATTIRRWDQRELIVPNKEFITGQLLNWTLSDNILRRDFAVGIAYGSDIRKAERILHEIAAADPRVLKEPPPVVLFKGFGDNSLDFELRVNYSGIENNLPMWHDINVAIDDKFREAGIEIAFPQQDLHIRSVDLDIPLQLRQGSLPPDDLRRPPSA